MARIFVVDDDDKFASMIMEGLALAGHKAVRARDLEEMAFLLSGGAPDLAVMDMQFRGGGGPKAAALLSPEIPIIVVSGMPLEQQRKWFGARDRTTHLLKPLRLPELLAAVAAFVGEAKA